MVKKAIIDVGTNSIKFLLCEGLKPGSPKILADEFYVGRLGGGLHATGLLSQETMERNCLHIARFVKKAQAYNVDEIICVGTMALRKAKNRDLFVDMVREKCGVNLQVIDGNKEAHLAYLAAISTLPLEGVGSLAIFDTGGGSTEFIFGQDRSFSHCHSINVGAVAITEGFSHDPVSPKEVELALEKARSSFINKGISGTPKLLVGIGGTVTSMGAVKRKMQGYKGDGIHGSKLSLKDIDEQIKLYRSLSLEERSRIRGLHPERAGVILAGACIVKVVLEILNQEFLVMSDRGLRHGIAYSLFS